MLWIILSPSMWAEHVNMMGVSLHDWVTLHGKGEGVLNIQWRF